MGVTTSSTVAATYEPIATQTLGSAAATVTFGSGGTLNQTYTDLILVVVSKWTGSGNSSFGMRFNSDSASNYSVTRLYGDGSSATSSRTANTVNTQSGQINSTNFSPNVFHIMNYSNSSIYKTVLARIDNTGSLTAAFISLWRSTSAITQIDLGYFDGNTGNFAAGSTFTLYGIKAA